MIFTAELLNRLEQNEDLKKSYAAQGSTGQNKFVAVPLIIGFIAAFLVYAFYGMGKTDPIYTNYAIIGAGVTLVCIVAVIVIQVNAKKKITENLDNVKVCIAKKIYGNDATQVYYSIYTIGSRRHDTEFIEAIADKIFNIDGERDEQVKNKINNLFSVNFEGMNATPILLPVAFTYGEEVYKQEFKFSLLEQLMKDDIAENNDQFIALSFNNRSVLPLKSLN
ncbi:hypothetical protein [Mucilaginibacter paludis]|uniref:Uncharacterized protein n=1 Tax=Mucilaginibacter paludis DSM 18603 TaxID=714943 RepID=H1YBI7_9SPHI|nr:hypothetical protein [Mucilaginibacter paludis]EHQ25058.1 hypothetical protein Mucpa_0877 [Mucilaginibacter paludis DSM 18603]